jgi:formiminotetrahydrofolate cyclodeaminase
MDNSLYKLSCEDFSKELFSKDPVPGGGGAAAYIGALGVSLGAMAVNLTRGKKKFAAFEPEYEQMLTDAELYRKRLLQLIDKDAAAFEPLSKAYSMPKDDPDYAQTMRDVTIAAAKAPLEMMRYCTLSIDLISRILEKCSKLLISDVGCAALAAEAALECAALNVFVNTRLLKGDAEADLMARQAEEMLADYIPKAMATADEVFDRMRA